MQGTQINGVEAGGVVDLDALLASRLLQPAPVMLCGRTWPVHTDLTGTEVIRCLALYNTNDIPGVLTFLVGTSEERAAINAAFDARKTVEAAATQAKAQGGSGTMEYSPLPYATAAQDLSKMLEGLPRMHSALALAHILRTSKALAEFALNDSEIHRTYNYTLGES